MSLHRIAGSLLCVLAFWTNASAALVLSIDSINLPVGQNGSISVSVTGANDPVSIFGFELRIAPLGGSTSSLRFMEENEGYLSDSSYIFLGNSGALNDATPSSVGAVSTSVLPNDTFIGLDGTANLLDVNVSSSRLLALIPVQHIFAPAAPETTVGHSFSVSLVAPSGNSAAFLGGTSNTGFGDAMNLPIAYSSLSGSVLITAVPEPSSLLLVASASLIGLARSRRGRSDQQRRRPVR